LGDGVDPRVEQLCGLDVELQLLIDLAADAFLGRLAELQLAAGQLPLVARVVEQDDRVVTNDDTLHRHRKAERAVVARQRDHWIGFVPVIRCALAPPGGCGG
jgi:hypothetical protein